MISLVKMPRITLPIVLDRLEQVAVLLLYHSLFTRLSPGSLSEVGLTKALYLISEFAVVVFILIRRPTKDIALRPLPWIVAAAGTFAPMFVAPGGDPIAAKAGVLMILIGTSIHIGAKISLNRSFGLVAANRGVQTHGLYRLVRHPMYFGYIMTHVGFLLANPSFRNFSVIAGCWSVLILRVLFEEEILCKDSQYKEFSKRVRWRLFPGIF